MTDPDGGIIWNHRIHFMDNPPYGVAWNKDQAEMLFYNYSIPILCVNIPRCQLCNSLTEAIEFFTSQYDFEKS